MPVAAEGNALSAVGKASKADGNALSVWKAAGNALSVWKAAGKAVSDGKAEKALSPKVSTGAEEAVIGAGAGAGFGANGGVDVEAITGEGVSNAGKAAVAAGAAAGPGDGATDGLLSNAEGNASKDEEAANAASFVSVSTAGRDGEVAGGKESKEDEVEKVGETEAEAAEGA